MSVENDFIVNIFKDIVSKMRVKNLSNTLQYLDVQYDAGRDIDILGNLSEKDASISLKDKKYPLIALKLPVIQKVTNGLLKITIRRIVIATLTNNEQAEVLSRFSNTEVFKTILQPCYKEFLKQVANSKWTSQGDPQAIIHLMSHNPGNQPLTKGLSDFVDIIEILDMEFYLNNIQNCK